MTEGDEIKEGASQVSTTVSTQPQPGVTPNYAQQLTAQFNEQCRLANSGGRWFYWIAGLSIINTIISLSDSSSFFVAGMGFTKILDELMGKYGGIVTAIALVINLIIAGVCVLLGYYACRCKNWAFIAGMVLYLLDTLIFLAVGMMFPLLFHCFALFCMFRGFTASRKAAELEAELSNYTAFSQR